MHILAIDQGTTSTKALVLDPNGRIAGISSGFAVDARYPRPGWVEFDPHAMLRSVELSAKEALQNAGLSWRDIAAIGLANQGETVIAFDGDSGEPAYPAISWQDRRGAPYVNRWREDGCEERVATLAGLRLDPYFSAPKLAWVLDHVPEARRLQAAGKLRYGTSDAWLMWQLTGGRRYVSDVATASRSMLLELSTLRWSEELSDRFGIPLEGLPELVANEGSLGTTASDKWGAKIPIAGLCVDQQAALFGHRAFDVGQAKITYGTGCFVLTNAGGDATCRATGLVTSIGWQIGDETTYVLEGGAFSGGSLVDWLCKLQLANDIEELSQLAGDSFTNAPVTLVPAFCGLGAPSWSERARGCWLGMDLGADRRVLARSAFEAIAFSVAQIIEAMGDCVCSTGGVRVDGGLSRSALLMQLQADLLGVPILCSDVTEFTALGVGYLAGLGRRIWTTPAELPNPVMPQTIYEPRPERRSMAIDKFERWKTACAAVVEMGNSGLFDDIGSDGV